MYAGSAPTVASYSRSLRPQTSSLRADGTIVVVLQECRYTCASYLLNAPTPLDHTYLVLQECCYTSIAPSDTKVLVLHTSQLRVRYWSSTAATPLRY